MAQTNRRITRPKIQTHEGGPAARIGAEAQLRRSVMATMLWEDSFYEDGISIAKRIQDTADSLPVEKVTEIMFDAKFGQYLRHAPLLLALGLIKRNGISKDALAKILDRVDLLPEILAMYWEEGKKPLAHTLKKALGLAFKKFDEYQLSKYDREKAIKLRDVLRIARPRPDNAIQAVLWKKVLDRNLAPADTWERELSTGGDKKATFTRFLKGQSQVTDVDEVETVGKHTLGDLAFLRNLRNMIEAGVEEGLIVTSMRNRNFRRVLPFQFIAAARYNPILEPEIERAMLKRLAAEATEDPMDFTVDVLVDVSGSMDAKLSAKSELKRIDAAKGVAMFIRELFEQVHVYSFAEDVVSIPARRGFALADAIGNAAGGTMVWEAVRTIGKLSKRDIMIVITDEQTADKGTPSEANAKLFVVINVGTDKNGIGYGKGTLHIDGWSDSVVRYLKEYVRKMLFRPVDTVKK